MKILVTGATGFMGIALCRRLEAEGHELVRFSSKSCNLTQAGSLDRFNDRAYDRIYHLAAWTQAGDFCLYHAGEQWIINQQINTIVLAWWHKSQPRARLICMGTSCAYAPESELIEENYLAGTPIESLYTYAMTKRMLYVGLLSLQKQFGLKHLCVVPSTLYGPGYHTDGRQMHFIFDLIRKILRGKLHGEPVVLWGDGHQRRELVFVEDFVTALLQLSDRTENDIVNVGAGEEFSIRDFAGMICQIVGYDFANIQFDTAKYVGSRSKCLRVEKMRRLLPGFKMTDLHTGLEQTIRWFQDEGKAALAKR